MKLKKAQGLSLNVVIIAAIVLIVLVVLVVILTGRTRLFTKGTTEITEKYSTNNCVIPGTGRECYANQCPTGRVDEGAKDCGPSSRCCS